MPSVEQTTSLLRKARGGDEPAAAEFLPIVYDELRAIAGNLFKHQPGQTLQPTALVHEAFLKLVDQSGAAWQDRAHFMAVAAKAMRHVLIDHARERGAAKRGGGWKRVTLDVADGASEAKPIDLLALDEALGRLGELDSRQASVVEMRFFAGLSVRETAEVLGVSQRTVELDWKMARAWLSRALTDDTAS